MLIYPKCKPSTQTDGMYCYIFNFFNFQQCIIISRSKCCICFFFLCVSNVLKELSAHRVPLLYELMSFTMTVIHFLYILCLNFKSLFNVLETINMDLFCCTLKDAWENIFQYSLQRYFMTKDDSGISLALLSKNCTFYCYKILIQLILSM